VGDFVRFEKRRRAATEENRIRGFRPNGLTCPTRPVDLIDQRLDIARLEVGIEQAAVEIAVIADRGAEGNVDVQP
jgi:hypothetical protein